MIHKDRFSTIFFFFFSMYISYESLNLGVGNIRKPGPGFFSFWAGVALGVLALVVLFLRWKLKRNGEGSGEQISWRGRILSFISLLVFVLFLDKLGFIITTFLFIMFLIKVVERKGWVISTLVALAIALASYGLFEILLKSQLPKGILDI